MQKSSLKDFKGKVIQDKDVLSKVITFSIPGSSTKFTVNLFYIVSFDNEFMTFYANDELLSEVLKEDGKVTVIGSLNEPDKLLSIPELTPNVRGTVQEYIITQDDRLSNASFIYRSSTDSEETPRELSDYITLTKDQPPTSGPRSIRVKRSSLDDSLRKFFGWRTPTKHYDSFLERFQALGTTKHDSFIQHLIEKDKGDD